MDPNSSLVVLAAALLIDLVLGEPLSADILAGGSLILFGIALSLRGGRAAVRPAGRGPIGPATGAPPKVT